MQTAWTSDHFRALALDEARAEIHAKTLSEIQAETAWKWAWRAVAAYEAYGNTQVLCRLLDAEDLRHEALEHAALTTEAAVLPFVEQIIAPARAPFLSMIADPRS